MIMREHPILKLLYGLQLESRQIGIVWLGQNGFHFLSYIIQVDGLTLFHAGDTVPYEGQIDNLMDIAFKKDDFAITLIF